jgi:hypothetical protein
VKESYQTPKLAVHGTVEEITKAFGNDSATDTIYWPDGRIYGYDDGSRDAVILPR